MLDNELAPGVVAQGVANGDVEGVAGLMTDPRIVISSSAAGAHVQMMCAAGDTTLLLTRHVRERGDLTLEAAVHQLTGRQADVFGSVSDFGNALFQHNLLPFEVTAFLLMVAIIGVVLLAGDDAPVTRRVKRNREPIARNGREPIAR